MNRALPILLWAVSALLAILARPITPIDETRYLAVAWEMYRSGEPWLLTLNGEVYAHKPPLIFWLISFGWSIFGVNDIWPRVLTASFGLGVLAYTWCCASRLLGGRRDLAGLSVVILMSSLLWLLYNGAVMFDVPLTFFTLGAISILFAMTGRGRLVEWLLVGLWLGLGTLMKGPVAWLHVLPLALLAPIWQPRLTASGSVFDRRWYSGLATALVVAAIVIALWLIPALMRGGPALFDEFLWRQTVDRMATTTHHLRPWWFYVAILPILLLPWSVMPVVWRGLRRLVTSRRDRSSSVVWVTVACWVVPVLLALSCFRGKQVHYLFPLLPALAILLAHAMGRVVDHPRGWARGMTIVSLVALFTAYIAIDLNYARAYDVRPLSRAIGALQAQGLDVANVGRYHGQFHFAGRLKRPIKEIRREEDWRRFIEAHPDGYVVTYSRAVSKDEGQGVAMFPFRSRLATLWRIDDIRDRPFEELKER